MAQQSNPELIEEMRWQLRKIQERKAANDRLLAGFGQTVPGTVAATSPDQSVTVVTGPGGAIEVRLADHAMRTNAATLSQVITTTIRNAMASATPQPPATPPRAAPPQRRPRPQSPASPDDEEPLATVFD